jgi:hypothetical protein
MFNTESNEFRRMGDAAISRGRVTYCQDAHLGWHAIEVLRALGDGMVAEDPA